MIDFNTTTGIVFTSPYTNTNEPSSNGSDKDQVDTDNTSKKTEEDPKKSTVLGQKSEELTQEEVQELANLKKRDREVRAHEQAHISAGGQYVRGGARFDYQKGPDGKRYAVGGEVSIDTSKVSGDPEATARKMQAIRRAALAPASPSGQDRSVAAKASQIETKMRMEIMLKRYEENASFETGKTEAKPEIFNTTTNQGKSSPVNINLLV